MSDDLWTVGGSPRTQVRGEHDPEHSPPASAALEPSTPPGEPVQFLGETFHLRPVEDYQWQLLVFADTAVGGGDLPLLAANAATLRLIRAALVDGEWSRFTALADRKRAQTERDIMPVIRAIFFRVTPHPTQPPSDSSGGRAGTPQSSEVERSSPVIARETASGRVDRADIVQMVAEDRDAAAAGRSKI